MAYIEMIDENDAAGELAELYRLVADPASGSVDEIMKVHSLRPASRPIAAILEDQLGGRPVDVLVSGDTHLEMLELRDGVLLVNPGSPTLPHHKEYRLGTVGLLEVTREALRAEILVLGHSDRAPNPGTPQQVTLTRNRSSVEEA